MQRQQSALDTLAEVSHRHMDYSVQNPGYEMQHTALSRQPNRVVEQALLAALERSNVNANDNINVSHALAPGVLPMYPNYTAQAQPGAQQPAFSDAPIQTPLVHTATAASEEVEPTYATEGAPLDPQLDDQMDVELASSAPECAQPQQTPEDLLTWAEKPQEFVTQPDPPSNEPNPDLSVLHNSDKVNARARFTDTRRKEVQEIRKRGACMRCRMLKKPCSEGTPCDTCKKIDTARLWKGTCLRTKLAEEFTLYSASHFRSKMTARVASVLQGNSPVPLSGRVEVRLLSHTRLAISLQAGRYIRSAAAQDVQSSLQSSAIPSASSSPDVTMIADDAASQRVSEYCANDAIRDACIEQEKNLFLQATLREAMELLKIERSQEAPSSKQKRAPRSNSLSRSELLRNVIELWIETQLLVLDSQESLQLRYNATTPSSQAPHPAIWSEGEGQQSSSIPLNITSQQIIRSQLLAATEQACHRLSKAITNELERRLLQRQQVSSFATFISAIILLTCMERITAFYHALDTSPSQSEAVPASSTTPDVYPHPDARPAGYPRSAPAPSALWPQGPHFARLLTTLLRMRALPPKTTRTSDNKLAVLLEPGLPVRLNGVAVREQQDENTARATDWLNLLRLDVDELKAKRDDDVAKTGWEMKFVSEVLLGEGM